MKTIYELKLHEDLEIWANVFVIRVPGGWIYNQYETEKLRTSTFVPINNEFIKS